MINLFKNSSKLCMYLVMKGAMEEAEVEEAVVEEEPVINDATVKFVIVVVMRSCGCLNAQMHLSSKTQP